MKVLSWNIDCKTEQDSVWRYILDENKPDFALLQECRYPGKVFEAQNNLILNIIGGTRNWGSGIYSKTQKINEIFETSEYRGWVTLGETVSTINHTLLVSLHAKLAGVPYVVPYLQKLLGSLRPLFKEYENIIIAGDFNAARLYDDVYPQFPAHTKHKLLFEWIEKDLGLVDCHFKLNGKEIQTMRGKSRNPYQNDHIFVSKHLSQRLISCKVLANKEIIKLSDHNPIVAEFAD